MSFEVRPTHVDGAIEPGLEAEYGDRPMQGAGFTAETVDGYAVGVFDGHGPDGHTFANTTAGAVLLTVTGESALMHKPIEIRAAEASDAIQYAGDDPVLAGKNGGTSATVVIAQGSDVVALQLGNGGVLFFPDNETSPGDRLTDVHDANNREEALRVVSEGGEITEDGHFQYPGVDGSLAISRAVGDIEFPFVSPAPEVVRYDVTEPGTLVVGTDGLLEGGIIPETADEVAVYRDASRNAEAGADEPDRERLATILAKLGKGLTGHDVAVATVEFDATPEAPAQPDVEAE